MGPQSNGRVGPAPAPSTYAAACPVPLREEKPTKPSEGAGPAQPRPLPQPMAVADTIPAVCGLGPPQTSPGGGAEARLSFPGRSRDPARLLPPPQILQTGVKFTKVNEIK